MAFSSHHRSVFVGNIPYGVTEEQLMEICQEVGPVVSFRLVVDRETGKPKGYGFCEYKDEETALSARRNLQGYQINGRQLRVDFAENDKGNDRNRDQSHGGPGLTAIVDPQKQVVSPAVHGEAAHHQPIGLHIAITAATVMTAALGGAQFSIQSNQNALQSQSALAHDPLTLHLSKMSRSQLIDILTDFKIMATQNRDLAHQLLLSRPQLPKALFQAQIMLGMVTSQVLQMPNLRLVSDQASQPSIKEGQPGQPALLQTLSGLLPHRQSQLQSGLIPYVQDGQVTSIPHNPLFPNQLAVHPKPPVQPRIPLQQHPSNHVVQLGTLSGPSNLMLPSVHSQTLGSLSVRPPIQVLEDLNWAKRISTYSNAPMGLEKTSIAHDSSEYFTRPSKLMKLDEGSSMSLSAGIADLPITNESFHVIGSSSLPVCAAPIAEVQQAPQPQVPPDVEAALLQQVLNLTPEQLSSLPLEQQQQVIQLQQALRRDQMQSS
ncbi:putative RNA recognition motif domain, cleavage stimulation factor subunit 2, hinge [Lupinus albus]|uniref:Putative RNA recognition motif domain, cleavage stimulation factor subunit 2, hinge n=1 Tax=Lupinus albus TaxID=3870 RepID=A0A6A4QBN3_LUPAL|nr:putative RNA recognition motif domain, cleavage stimulation factor subunit 2, hinge [Lupinus albus]